jgi:hypothetical protein
MEQQSYLLAMSFALQMELLATWFMLQVEPSANSNQTMHEARAARGKVTSSALKVRG